MRVPGPFLLTLLLAFTAGCATYKPMPLTPSAVDRALTVPPESVLAREARTLHHPILRPIEFDPRRGLSPDEAAVLSVLISPSLRADRNRLGLSGAQLIAAGLLPNPQVTYSMDFVTSGPGVTNPYGIGLSWDFTSLITHESKIRAVNAALQSVRIDVAWVEWQTAQAAKAAVFDQVALTGQLARARDVDRRLRENVNLIRGAVNRHQRTVLELAAAQAAADTAHSTALALEQQLAHQRFVLLRSMGLPPSTALTLRADIVLPARLQLPSEQELVAGLESRRLDLIALRKGYESQEETVRVAVLAQFPKISLGGNRMKDNTGVYTAGFSATVDLPIFDRNQAAIATERATRQKLFDEYVSRVFQARSDIAMLVADTESVTRQIAAAEASLPALSQLVETYRLAVERGNADVLSYYAAQNDLAQRAVDVLKLEQQLTNNLIGLELASGLPLPQPAATGTARQDDAAARPTTTPSTSPTTRETP